jgi:RNA polymerase sigma-70 factor, ECF subfamily
MERVLDVLDTSGPRLFRLLKRLTLREDVAEVLMQELFLGLHRSNGFRRASDPAAYAYRTAMHLAFAWHRRRKRRPEAETIRCDPESPAVDPLARIIHLEQFELVLQSLGKLPKSGRDIVVMRYIQGDSYEEIAGHFGKTTHQVRALCHKAIMRIRDLTGDRLHSTDRE